MVRPPVSQGEGEEGVYPRFCPGALPLPLSCRPDWGTPSPPPAACLTGVHPPSPPPAACLTGVHPPSPPPATCLTGVPSLPSPGCLDDPCPFFSCYFIDYSELALHHNKNRIQNEYSCAIWSASCSTDPGSRVVFKSNWTTSVLSHSRQNWALFQSVINFLIWGSVGDSAISILEGIHFYTTSFVTDHVRITREANVFRGVCSSVHRGGGGGGGVSCLGCWGGGVVCPVQVLPGGGCRRRGRGVHLVLVLLRERGRVPLTVDPTLTRWPYPPPLRR